MKKAVFALKIAISAALLYVLISRSGPGRIIGIFRQTNGLSFIAAVACYASIILVSALRLRLLIAQQLSLRTVFAISAIGSFFNMLLPSGISGDIARAYYINRELDAEKKGRAVELVAPLVMERYFGLGSVLIVGIVVFPFAVRFVQRGQMLNTVAIIAAFLAIVFLGGIILFRFRLLKKNRLMREFYQYLNSYRSRGRLLAIFFHSVLIQAISICAVFLLSCGMGADVPLSYYVVILPLINILTILPVTLGGVGLREGAFLFFLGFQGVQPHVAVSLSLMAFFASIVASLIGLYEFMRYRQSQSVIQ